MNKILIEKNGGILTLKMYAPDVIEGKYVAEGITYYIKATIPPFTSYNVYAVPKGNWGLAY